jgi:hypothetical protein
VTCMLDVSTNEGDGCLHKGDCDVEITCLYMVILAAPITNRRWIGNGIGLDLVGEVELHVPAGVDGISRNHLRQIRKSQPHPNC